uniref:SMP-30/Gluconolactonase/LRE-like region domain-containing protein n=1 Tax=Chromera velia CCMP2878 TaxID=1169474 RepID=A0A0G4HIE3_9ALVE|eukprot:Cvel_6987.t1-p1 / transcript=Cvel_6987.t1 / gene=Cvel_6987 / organism=Chromera_velia_CCMP2878 / gene_product=hypothetical protein / transcript_product=hypothetical protein / location=Cvel_scaffold355:50142-53482(-) / protein_length=311 / sequence_SO=supercontig / SO=protein_coding / is_pseudo=false
MKVIKYGTIPKGYLEVDKTVELKPLIETELSNPQGLAYDRTAKRLYVTDPRAGKIFFYDLDFSELSAGVVKLKGGQKVAVDSVEPRWVAVDSQGSIFFTDESANKVQSVPADQTTTATFLQGNAPATPRVVFEFPPTSFVSRPGGIATDGSHVYWGNKEEGKAVGSVVKGTEGGDKEDSGIAIASVTDKVYGVCLASDKLLFLDGNSGNVYGVRKAGGAVTTVVQLQKPRGCAFDSDATVFVTDKGTGTVVSIATGGSLSPRQGREVTARGALADVFGIAVAREVPRTFSFFGWASSSASSTVGSVESALW